MTVIYFCWFSDNLVFCGFGRLCLTDTRPSYTTLYFVYIRDIKGVVLFNVLWRKEGVANSMNGYGRP